MTRWRPQLLWIPMGGLMGALAGAATGGVLLVLVTLVGPASSGPDGLVGWLGGIAPALFVGGLFGSIPGVAVGLLVGLQMAFLVGAHLPREEARGRAHVLGCVLPPVTMVLGSIGWSWFDAGTARMPSASDFSAEAVLWWTIALGGASLLGGSMARWLAGFHPPRGPVS